MRFDPSQRMRSVLGVTSWLAAAAAATTVGVLVVGAIGTGIVGSTSHPLSSAEVDRALATAAPSPTATSPGPATTSPTPTAGHDGTGTPSGSTRVVGSPGGTVAARCAGDRVTLTSWSPRQGYEADDVHPGPGHDASLKFESDDREVRIRVTCAGGVPRPDVRTRVDD